MHKKIIKLSAILCVSSLLSGCWDQEPLREARLALFNKDKLTGHLPLKQAVLFVLLTEKMGERKKLNKELSKQLTKEAKKITEKLIVMLSVLEDILSLITLIYGRKKIGIKIMQK